MWGIHSPFSTLAPDREERMIGAAKIIKTGRYDFIMFQVCKMKPRSFRTQGVLDFKFPISTLTQTQDQHRCHKIRKIANNYVPIPDFATRPLNLRKSKKFPKFSKINTIFLLQNANFNQRCTFSVYFLSILDICFIETIFST